MAHLFLDEKNGDDSNDGLSLEGAVKTRKRLMSLVSGCAADVLISLEHGKAVYQGAIERGISGGNVDRKRD